MAVDQFALERSEETLAHGVIEGVACSPGGGADACGGAAVPERPGRVLGGLNRSSQRFGDGGCDGEAEAWCGQDIEGADAIAEMATGGEAGGQAAVLAGNRGGTLERGRGAGRRCLPAGGIAVVPGGRRHATITSCAIGAAAVGAAPVI